MRRLHQITDPVEPSDSDIITIVTTCHTDYQGDAITEFYRESADMAGIELNEWLDSEPF